MKYFKKGNSVSVTQDDESTNRGFINLILEKPFADYVNEKIHFSNHVLSYQDFTSFTLEDGTIKNKTDFPTFKNFALYALKDFFFVAKSNGGDSGGTDKGIWNPKTNTPDIFTLLQKSGEFAVIDGLDAGETYNFDFGGTKGGVVAFTIGDKVYFNGVIFQKQESYIPTADQIIYDKTNPLLGSIKDVVDLKANQSTTYTKTQVDNALDLKADQSTTYTKTQVDNALNLKANSTDVYIKTEVDNALDLKENTITAGTTSQYYRGDKTFQNLNKSAVGLSNVDNTSDLDKPLSTATQNALDLKANQSTTYTKTQVDNALVLKADKTQIINEVLKLTYLLY